VAVLAFGGPLRAQTEISNAEAVRRDAQSYAASNGVSVDEAVRRMALQLEIGALSARLEEGERETFAGLWIEHGPEFHAVAAFTRNGQQTLQRYVGGGTLATLVRPAAARVSLAHLQEIQRNALRSVMGRGVRAEAGLDVRNNRAEVYVLDRRPVDAEVQRGTVRIPEHARVVQVQALSEPEVDIFGGLALTTCTSGFSVRNSAGTRGVTTAGHCGASQARNGSNLPFVAEAYGSYYDVQWHTAPGFTVRPLFYDGSAFRNLTAVLSRSSQALNSYVCKHGKTTGYTCGYLIDKNYQRTATTVTFTNTWMRVQGGTVNLSEGGDSGGPWFNGNTGYGTHAVGIGNDAVYMAINYITSGLPVSVLLSP
jgi:hypothetical protein